MMTAVSFWTNELLQSICGVLQGRSGVKTHEADSNYLDALFVCELYVHLFGVKWVSRGDLLPNL